MEEEGVAEGAETLAQMASREPPQVGGNDSGGMGGEIPAQDEGESTRAQAVARATPYTPLSRADAKSKELPSEEQLVVGRGIKPGAKHWNTKDLFRPALCHSQLFVTRLSTRQHCEPIHRPRGVDQLSR